MDEVLVAGWKSHLQTALDKGINRPNYKFYPSGEKFYMSQKIHMRDGYSWRRPCHEIICPYDDSIKETSGFIGLEIKHLQDSSKSRSHYLPLMRIGYRENPNDGQQAFWFARELFYNNFNDEAIKVFQQFVDMPEAWGPEKSASYEFLAQIMKRMDANSEAIESLYKKAIEVAPYRRDPYVAIAKFYVLEGRPQDAIVMLTQALEITVKPTDYLSRAESWNGTIESMLSSCRMSLPLETECDD
jgi:tetratricopeptide (TPR) repeat protein